MNYVNQKQWKNVLASIVGGSHGELKLSNMFPLLLLLDPLFSLFLSSLSRSRDLDVCLNVINVYQDKCASQREGEGVPENNRNGRHWENTKPNLLL